MSIPAIVVHGGSGTIPNLLQQPEVKKRYTNALQKALNQGFEILQQGAPATEAVIKAICSLEDCELFNAGKGAVFNAEGHHEMDAALMDGKGLQAGAVAGIKGVKNPILLAHKVLTDTDFVFLCGDEATAFARKKGLEFKPDDYFFTQQRYDQWQELKGSDRVELDHSSDQKFGTVGTVAVDKDGHVAAGTSTGGMTNKAWGRVGDSPIIGAGTYANDATCAVSCTGYGEYFIRSVAAYDVSCRMEYGGMNLKEAAESLVQQRVKRLGGEGGLIAIDAQGNIAMPFNTEGMYRGMKNDQTNITTIY